MTLTAEDLDALAARIAERMAVGRLLTARAAMRYLGLGRRAFYAELARPGFPAAVRMAGGGKRYRRKDLDHWLARLRTARDPVPEE